MAPLLVSTAGSLDANTLANPLVSESKFRQSMRVPISSRNAAEKHCPAWCGLVCCVSGLGGQYFRDLPTRSDCSVNGPTRTKRPIRSGRFTAHGSFLESTGESRLPLAEAESAPAGMPRAASGVGARD